MVQDPQDDGDDGPKTVPPPAPPPPDKRPGLKLRKQPCGTILARCPSRKAGLKTAKVAFYHPLDVYEVGKDWHLVDADGVLRFTIGK